MAAPDSDSPSSPSIALRASVRGARGPLVPEQAALFDLTLDNPGPAKATVLSLELNHFTPIVRLYDGVGALLHQATPLDAERRVAGESGEPAPTPPNMVEIEPGASAGTWVNMWTYLPPLPPGKYAFEAQHNAPLPLTSSRVPFVIEPARVQACALGYESPARMATLLAWTAVRAGQEPELFLRLSGFGKHGSVQQGGAAHGKVAAGAHLAVDFAPTATWLGWVAVAHDTTVELIHHNMTFPLARTGPVTLPISDAVPIPRFPGGRNAVFLATGSLDGKPALAGVEVDDKGKAATPWTVALGTPPVRAACAPAGSDTAVLVVADRGKSSTVSLLTVSAKGQVTAAVREVHSTAAQILALAADTRPGRAASFVLVEGDRSSPDKLAVVEVPLSGAVEVLTPPVVVTGWPYRGGKAVPAVEMAIEVSPAGVRSIALIDEERRFFTGTVEHGISLARKQPGCRCAHVAALSSSTDAACFTEQGQLFHAGVR